jgi:hypothetical protein
MSVKTVHTNKQGKYTSAVFFVTIPREVADGEVAALRPRSYGRWSTPFGIRRHGGLTEWYELHVNTGQTTPADLLGVIERKFGLAQRDGVFVTVEAAVPGRGASKNPGSSRKGIRRVRTTVPTRHVVAAE